MQLAYGVRISSNLTWMPKSNSSRPRKTPARKTRMQFAQNSFCGPAQAGTDADLPNGFVKNIFAEYAFLRVGYAGSALCAAASPQIISPQISNPT